MIPIDIAIAGCGPAGLAAALLLARDGHRVTIFERFETPQPVGSGLMLQPTGLAVLHRLELGHALIARGAPIAHLFGQNARQRTVLDVHYAALRRDGAFGVGIHRATLFDVLHAAAIAAEIPIETGKSLCATELHGSKRWLRFDDDSRSGPFDLVVDALGTRTPLAPPTGRSLAYGALWASLDCPPELGFRRDALEQRYRRASVMAGVLPIGTPPLANGPQIAFFWSLRADRRGQWQSAGLDAWKREVSTLWPATAPLLDQIDTPDRLTFAAYAHRTLPRPAEAAMIHIGDAWHSASPQLGQGANMALLDAYALSQGLRAEQDVGDALAHAVALRRRHVLLYQGMSSLFTPVYQSDSHLIPFIRDTIVGPLSKIWPATWIQAAMVSGLIGNPLSPLGLGR
ncbi:FAD-dependent oxidoreductase [Sphingomonas sp. ASY06-1R]|uniref:FAD-dependent oxidoreductase n=1 Tax=Sphingomonas sp. ASY06-1R TaxID=3445771 RepID=UPI003FA1D384